MARFVENTWNNYFLIFFFFWIFQNQSAVGNVIQLTKKEKPYTSVG